MITKEQLTYEIATTVQRFNDIMSLDDDVSERDLLWAFKSLNVSRPHVRLDWINKEYLNIEEAIRLANLQFEFGECQDCGQEYFTVDNDGTGCDGRCQQCWDNK